MLSMHRGYFVYDQMANQLDRLAQSIPSFLSDNERWYVSKSFAKIQGLIVLQRQEMDALGYRDKLF